MRNLNKLYGGSGAKTTSLNPSVKPRSCGDRLELPPSQAQVQEFLSSRCSFTGSGHPPTLQNLPLSLNQQKDGAVESKDSSRTLWRRLSCVLWIPRGPTLSWQSDTKFSSFMVHSLSQLIQILYSTCKDNRASVTESTITIALLMIHEYTRTKYTFSLICQEQDFLYLFYLGTLAL